jgi:predicted ATPase/transcriptional regulator with XRE-family HTH domain
VLGEEGATVARFGDQLRRLRERAGWTQEELAERAGLTPHAVSALERGTRTRPYPHTVRSLADALEVSEADRAALVASVPRRGATTPSAGQRPRPEAGDTVIRAEGLVIPPTPLHGRAADLAAVAELVRGGARLVTLTGPGGVGKTRLAAAASDALAPDYPDGVVQVSLAPLAAADAVVAAVGRALGLVVGAGREALSAVADHLEQQRLLLVLDNFEHLLSAAADVGHLVAVCPGLTVLTSSRSPLRLRGEREYGVAPLALPPADVISADDLALSPAGALMLERVGSVAPRLALTPDEVGALAELCHRLAGLPLAIELASAHLRLLAPRTLLERLTDVMAASAARDLPERQRTMRATLDWSYGLLADEERKLFRLLGIFRGGATLEAVEAVAEATAPAGAPAASVLPVLARLVEHSLVVVRVGVDGEHRYDLLEPVAQYARSLLLGDEAGAAAAAHARVFLDLAEAAAWGYEGADQVTWLARAGAEDANLLVAVDRSLDSGDVATAGRITWAMWLYWWLRGQPAVGRRRAELCLDAGGLTDGLRSRVHLTAATMSYAGGDLEASAKHWAEAFRIGQLLGDPELACKGGAGIGLAALGAGDLRTAATRFTAALADGEEAGAAGVWLRSLAHVWLGTVRLLENDHAEAVVEIQRGLDLARSRGDRLSTYVALYNLSQVAIAAGDHARARAHLEEGILLSEETQDMANLAYLLEAAAVIESAEGRHARVARLLGASRGLRETVGANVYAYYVPDESLRVEAEKAARSALGEDGYDDLEDAGRSGSASDSIRFALDVSTGLDGLRA